MVYNQTRSIHTLGELDAKQTADQRETSTHTVPSQAAQHAPGAWLDAIAKARDRLKDLGLDPDKICERVELFSERAGAQCGGR